MACSGYRDTDQLRVQNESQFVTRKVLTITNQIHSLHQTKDLQARDAFFAYYVTSRCWQFLGPYHHPLGTPKELTLAIDAVSLAYLSHQVYSNFALVNARERDMFWL